MFSTAHLASGLALGFALGLDGAPLVALVLASVLTDWDYGFQLLTGRNHRTLVTHSPITYAVVLGPLGLVWPIAWWVLAGSLLHFTLDVWEYGIRVFPWSRRVVGLRLIPGIERMRFGEYLRTYFTDPRFLAAEVAFAVAAVALGAWRLA